MIIAFFLRGSKKKKRFIIIYVLFVVVGLPRLVAANSVSINQLSYYFDNSTNNYEYTGWGAVDFAYTGVSGNVGYFNLWLDGVADPMDAWQVRNMPVESIEGAGVSDSIRYCFDLQGYEYNNNISGHYAFSTNVETEAPTGTAFTTTVRDDSVIMNAGLTDDPLVDNPLMPDLAVPCPAIGGEVENAATKHVNAGFPNQDCGPNRSEER